VLQTAGPERGDLLDGGLVQVQVAAPGCGGTVRHDHDGAGGTGQVLHPAGVDDQRRVGASSSGRFAVQPAQRLSLRRTGRTTVLRQDVGV